MPPTWPWQNSSANNSCRVSSPRTSTACTTTQVTTRTVLSSCTAHHEPQPVPSAERGHQSKSFSSASTLARSTQLALTAEASLKPPPSCSVNVCQRQNLHEPGNSPLPVISSWSSAP